MEIGRQEQEVEELGLPRSRQPQLPRHGGPVGDGAPVDGGLQVVREGELLGDLRGPAHGLGLRGRWCLGQRDAPVLVAEDRLLDEAEGVVLSVCVLPRTRLAVLGVSHAASFALVTAAKFTSSTQRSSRIVSRPCVRSRSHATSNIHAGIAAGGRLAASVGSVST